MLKSSVAAPSERLAWPLLFPAVVNQDPNIAANPAGDSEGADAAMERYARGDNSAFAELYDALGPRLFGYLLRQTRNKARAEDLLQQTFLRMHCARGRYVRGARVVPWCFAIARRLLIDGVRRSGREVSLELREECGAPPPVSMGLQQDEALHSKEIGLATSRALSHLPEIYREAFQLIEEDGLSMAEAAEMLGITLSAAKLRAFRGRKAVRAELAAFLEGSYVSKFVAT